MDLLSLDHVHICVPDLERARELFGPFLGGSFTPVYGGPELNAWGSWNTSGGDFVQPIRETEGVFGGAPVARRGILSLSFRVTDVDRGIEQARTAGMRLVSRIGSEDVGFGKNVVQAQFAPDTTFGLGVELVERQIPGDPHRPLTQEIVDHVEHFVRDLEPPRAFFEGLFGSPFDAPVVDDARRARSVRHPRFGVQLTAPTGPRGETAERIAKQGEGPHAIAFQCACLDRGIEQARALGLALWQRRSAGPGAEEAEFAPEAGVVVKLVARTG